MPPLSVWMIRLSLLSLVTGMGIGGVLLWHKGLGGIPAAWRWLPLHIHLLLVGWMVQLALGVAYWILPRFTVRRAADERVEQRRGREGLASAGALLLNASTLLALGGVAGWSWGYAVAALAALLGGLAFALHLWPRIKPFMAG